MTEFETGRPWLSQYEGGVPHDLAVPEVPVYSLLQESAGRFPERAAVQFVGAATSYRALWDQVQRFASALQTLGVRPGDRVSVMLPNCPQFLVAFFGASLAGAVVVNTSPLYVARELEHQLTDSGSETLVVLDSLYPRYAEVQDRVPVRRVVVTGIQDALPFPKNLLYPLRERLKGQWRPVRAGGRVFAYRELLRGAAPAPTPVPVSPQSVALLQYTGGTTGTPKGAMLSHRNLVANCLQNRAMLTDLREGGEVMLAAIPFFHVYGMTTAMNVALASGATLVLVPNPRDIPMLLGLIGQYRPTLFPGVPTLYNAINHHPETPRHDLTSIRACISGSAPLPLSTARQFSEITGGAKLVEGYGLTEASPVTHVNPLHGEQREGSIGLPLPGVDARIVDAAGRALPPGEVGELWVSGPNVMLGYWQHPEESAGVLHGQGGQVWLATGDIAVMDPEGYFRIVDRAKDVIIAGGFNVYPREIEEVLYAHPAVLEAAVVGVKDEYRGESAKAFVVFRPGHSASPDELKAYCRAHLSPYKVPRAFETRAELPKSAAGKVLRRALQAGAPQDAATPDPAVDA